MLDLRSIFSGARRAIPRPTPRENTVISAISATRENLKQLDQLAQLIQPATIRQAKRFHRFARLPRLLDDVYVIGYDRLPARAEPAPILALSHKKIHDVGVIVEVMAGRPLQKFHDITLIAQAGIFSAMYTYRDLIPRFCKLGPFSFVLRPLSIATAHRTGKFLRKIFSDVHAYPVYREGRDVPGCEADFIDANFAGPAITGKSYAEFLKFASRETRHSLIRVQQDLVELNRTFLILPEGGYLYDGGVAPLQDFLGVCAYRKQAAVIFGALSYDELCPDRLGRIRAWVHLLPSEPPPAAKTDVPEFLAHGRRLLTNGTVILASHLIAAAVREFQASGHSFREQDLQDAFERRFQEMLARGASLPVTYDPGLDDAQYRAERFHRFVRRGFSRYFRKVSGGRFQVSPTRVARFARTERTVDDIAWNYNHARHIFETGRDGSRSH